MRPTIKKIVIGLAAGVVVALLAVGAFASENDNLNGDVSVQYRYRSDGNQTDQDAMQSLSLDYYRSTNLLGSGSEIGFVFYGTLQEDLDSEESRSLTHSGGRLCSSCHTDGRSPGQYRFAEAADNYDNSFAAWIYLAYAELNSHGFLKTLRVGRQEMLEFEPIAFDGALATMKAAKMLNVTVLGGQPVNLFEDWESKKNDYIAGGYISYQATRNLMFLAGYLALQDEVIPIGGEKETIQESLIFGEVNFRPMREMSTTARITVLEDKVRDVSARIAYFNEDIDLRVNAGYLVQPEEREAETLTSDPYAIILGNSMPYHSGSLTLYKGIGEKLGVEAGGAFKELIDSEDESLYNHSYQHYTGTAYLYKVPFSGTTISAGLDYWTADNEINNEGYHGEINQKFGQKSSLRLGTQYFIYKVDEITGEEKEEVQTYYAGVTVAAGKHLSVGVDYTFEDGDSAEADILKVKLNYEF